MTHLYFKPWVGQRYREGGMFKQRILILGEAHYEWEEDHPLTPDLTRDCIKEQISGHELRRFWTNIVITFLNRRPSLEDKRTFWHSVVFSNLIQESVGFGPRRPPASGMWDRSSHVLGELLNRYRPDLALVLGYRLWEQLPDLGSPGPAVRGARRPETWVYPRRGGQTLAFPIIHPSAGFSAWKWHPLVVRAINLSARSS